MHRSVGDTLAHQAGVISRAQALAIGESDNSIERLIRRREWARVHPGVYVEHTGPPTWEQRAWAAVLCCAPAALAGRSALRAHRLTGPRARGGAMSVEIVVAESRRLTPPAGVDLSRRVHFDRVAQLHLSPPRVTIEHALVTTAAAASTEDGAVAMLADGCQSGRTTAARLAAELRLTPRLRRRGLLLCILDDVAAGAFSALERRYLVTVERRHGLPRGLRQAREEVLTGVVYRDVVYGRHGMLVELDGRLGHEWSADRWSDLDRDVHSAESGRLTLRLGWRQVLDPCRLAAALGRILRARGWAGATISCSANCPAGNSGGSPARAAGDPPLSVA